MNVEVLSAIGGPVRTPVGDSCELQDPALEDGIGGVGVQIARVRPAWGSSSEIGAAEGSETANICRSRQFHCCTSDTPWLKFRNGIRGLGGREDPEAPANSTCEPSPDGDGLVTSPAPRARSRPSSFTLKPDEDALRQIHPGLVDRAEHRDPPLRRGSPLREVAVSPEERGSGPAIEERPPGTIAGGSIVASQRNAPPLFGLGLIDALPDEVLVATAAQEPAPVRGRVNRMKSGRIGKFGWKAQTTDLREFVLGGLRQRTGPGGPRPSAGDLSAGPGRQGDGPGSDAGGV